MQPISHHQVKYETRKLKKLGESTFVLSTEPTSITTLSDEIVGEIVTVFKDHGLMSQHWFRRCKVLAPEYDRELKSRLDEDRVKLYATHAVLHFFAMSGFFLTMPAKLDWHPWIYRLPATSIIQISRRKTIEVDLEGFSAKIYNKVYDVLARAAIVRNNEFTRLSVHQTVRKNTTSYPVLEEFSKERLMGWIHHLLIELPLAEHRMHSCQSQNLVGKAGPSVPAMRAFPDPFNLPSPESLC